MKSDSVSVYLVEKRKGDGLLPFGVRRIVSPKGPYSQFPLVVPAVASINPVTFPLPSYAAKDGFPVEGLTANNPPTPPAPCIEPLKSSPQRKLRITPLVPFNSATRFQPS